MFMILAIPILALLLGDSPVMPRIERDVCLGEECCFGRWRVTEAQPVWEEPDPSSVPIFALKRGEIVTTRRAIIITRRPGIIEVLKPMQLERDVVVPAGGVLYSFYPIGEGMHRVQYGDATYEAFIGIYQPGVYPDADPRVRILTSAEWEYWKELENADGLKGWAKGRFAQECRE